MENQVFGAKWDSRTWASGGNKNFKEKTRAPLDPGRKKMNKEEIREENGVGGFPGGSDGKESACNVGAYHRLLMCVSSTDNLVLGPWLWSGCSWLHGSSRSPRGQCFPTTGTAGLCLSPPWDAGRVDPLVH